MRDTPDFDELVNDLIRAVRNEDDWTDERLALVAAIHDARSRPSDSGTTPADTIRRERDALAQAILDALHEMGPCTHATEFSPFCPRCILTPAIAELSSSAPPAVSETNQTPDVEQVATDAGHIVSVVGSVSREQRGEK